MTTTEIVAYVLAGAQVFWPIRAYYLRRKDQSKDDKVALEVEVRELAAHHRAMREKLKDFVEATKEEFAEVKEHLAGHDREIRDIDKTVLPALERMRMQNEDFARYFTEHMQQVHSSIGNLVTYIAGKNGVSQ